MSMKCPYPPVISALTIPGKAQLCFTDWRIFSFSSHQGLPPPQSRYYNKSISLIVHENVEKVQMTNIEYNQPSIKNATYKISEISVVNTELCQKNITITVNWWGDCWRLHVGWNSTNHKNRYKCNLCCK